VHTCELRGGVRVGGFKGRSAGDRILETSGRGATARTSRPQRLDGCSRLMSCDYKSGVTLTNLVGVASGTGRR
jgi:hypothetical protein